MADPIHFYFDFISPYGYVAAAQIEDLAARCGRKTLWHAFNMRSVNANVLGVDKPLFLAPLKGPYFQQDVPRVIRYHGLPYNPGSVLDFNPLAAMRAFWFIADQSPEQAKAFAKRVFHLFFAEGIVLNDPGHVAMQAADYGVDQEEAYAFIVSPEAKARLKTETDAAVAAGVWGTPSFVVGDQLFWGADRMGMLEEWITRGGW